MEFSQRSRDLRLLIAVLTSPLLIVGVLIHYAMQPVIPCSILRQIQLGDAEQKLLALLGEPAEKIDGQQWIYEHSLGAGWVSISLDAEGKVTDINDESAFACGCR